MFHRSFLPTLLLLLFGLTARAQQVDSTRITLEMLFDSPYFQGESLGPTKWTNDGAAYMTLEPSKTISDGRDLVRYDVETGTRQVIVPAEDFTPEGGNTPLYVEEYAWAPDENSLLIFTNSERVWRYNTRGDYWVLNLGTRALRKLGGDAKPSTLMFAKFSPEGRRVAFVRENNLFVEDLDFGKITQLTFDGSRTLINGTFDWVYEEELFLRDGFRFSPDGKYIAYWQLDASGVRDFLLINNTDSLYSFTIPVQYPKVGTTNSAARIGVVSTTGGGTQWLDVPGDPRNNYITKMEWADAPQEVFIVQLNRRQDTANVYLGNYESGGVRKVLTEQDSAWVDLVNLMAWTIDEVHWIDSASQFTWWSDRDGWRHLYSISRDGSQNRLLTPGDFDVIEVSFMDLQEGWIYYIASPDNPSQRYLFRTRLDEHGQAERLTPPDQPGTHSYTISPNAKYALHTYSTFDSPSVIELISLPDHRVLRTLIDNHQLKQRVSALRKGDHDFFYTDAGNGLKLHAWIMKPVDFDSTKQYPALYYAYGGPAGQTVVDQWLGISYLWHLMLTQQGYIVISVDNRGTPSPRGRSFRKAIRGDVGSITSADQAAATQYISRTYPYVDSNRIGIWGWSGGGSATLNALFRYPDIYHVGMAVAPAPVERLYDTIYTERYLGLLEENPEGYRLSSAITFAEQLEGDLLIVHGTGDDNVHYQGTELLINALIAANKPFDMMAYPNRSHGIYEGAGTTRHVFELLTRYLREHLYPLPAGEPVKISRSR